MAEVFVRADALWLSIYRLCSLIKPMQVADAEGALKAAMARVNELEGHVAAAPEPIEAAPQVARSLHADPLKSCTNDLACASILSPRSSLCHCTLEAASCR